MRIFAALTLILFCSSVFSEEILFEGKTGCWSAIAKPWMNKITVCLNYDLTTISVYYPNKTEKNSWAPTLCTAAGNVKYLSKNKFNLENQKGSCKNGRGFEQPSLECEEISQDTMHCIIPNSTTDLLIFNKAGI